MQVRRVHQLLRAAVQHGRLDQVQVELRAAVEQGRLAGTAGDGRKHHHLEPVDETGREQRSVQGDAVVRAHRDVGRPLEAFDRGDGVLVEDRRVLPARSLWCRRHLGAFDIGLLIGTVMMLSGHPEGDATAALAKKYDVSAHSVRTVLAAAGADPPSASLSSSQVAAIQQMHAGGQSVASIARSLHVAESTARFVIVRPSWSSA